MRKHKELVFILTGALLLLTTAGFVVYSINFLMKNAGSVFNNDSANAREIIRFNLEGLKNLGIIK